VPDWEKQGLVDGGPGVRIRAKVTTLMSSDSFHGRMY